MWSLVISLISIGNNGILREKSMTNRKYYLYNYGTVYLEGLKTLDNLGYAGLHQKYVASSIKIMRAVMVVMKKLVWKA